MKNSGFDRDPVPNDVLELARGFLSFQDVKFTAQVDYLGLDPTTDFMYSDLSLIDFSACDLRGYNFTGANLRGCVGYNVLWDESTNFTDADAQHSLFAYAVNKKRFFDANPEDLETVRRLTEETWTNSILGVERLLRSDKGKGSSLRIARAVFDETTSSVVRSNVLAFMRIASDSAEEHKSFIYNIFARFADQPKIVVSGVRTLSAFYRNDNDVFVWLSSFLDSPSPDLRREAFKGLLVSKHFGKAFESLREYALISDDSLTRRAFLGRVARVAGPKYLIATNDPDVKNFLDFGQPISYRNIYRSAHQMIRMIRLGQSASGAVDISIMEHEILEFAEDFKRRLTYLKTRFRIPFVFE